MAGKNSKKPKCTCWYCKTGADSNSLLGEAGFLIGVGFGLLALAYSGKLVFNVFLITAFVGVIFYIFGIYFYYLFITHRHSLIVHLVDRWVIKKSE